VNRRDFVRVIGIGFTCASLRVAGFIAAGDEHGVDAAAKDGNSRPWVYAFWLDGNVTREGITADLEAMKNAGIGGLLFMDGSLGMPAGACRFMSGAWQEQSRHMVAEARGLEVIVAAAGGAAHLPGMVAAKTTVPVLGVPIPATMLNGLDSLLSIVQMPKGIPVGTLAIGEPGAINAALLATSIVSTNRPELRERLRTWRQSRTDDVLANTTISASD